MSSVTHELRDRWFVSFLPLLTPETVNSEFKGDWSRANHERMQKLDWVTSVEELWSTMNSLPKIQYMGGGSTYIFARQDKDPSFETFPNGSRVMINLLKAPALEVGLETVIAAVMGETITEEVSPEMPICDVVRIVARTTRDHADIVRVEVWLNDKSYSGKIVAYLHKLFHERGLTSAQYTIAENAFDAPGSAKTMQGSPTFTSPTSADRAY